MPPGVEVVEAVENDAVLAEEGDVVLRLLDVSAVGDDVSVRTEPQDGLASHLGEGGEQGLRGQKEKGGMVKGAKARGKHSRARALDLESPTWRRRKRNCLFRLLVSIVSISSCGERGSENPQNSTIAEHDIRDTAHDGNLLEATEHERLEELAADATSPNHEDCEDASMSDSVYRARVEVLVKEGSLFFEASSELTAAILATRDAATTPSVCGCSD